MANTNAPFGFQQYRGNGSAPTYELVEVRVDYNATNIFEGDPVSPNTSSVDGTYVQSSSTGGSPAALGIGGIFYGCRYLSVSQKRMVWSNYWPGSDVASTSIVYAYIANDPNAQFKVQTDATGLTQAAVNQTIGFVIGTGNTANGLSGAYLDSTTLGAGANNPFRVVSLVTDPPGVNGTFGNGQAYDQVIVAFNNVTTRNFTGA